MIYCNLPLLLIIMLVVLNSLYFISELFRGMFMARNAAGARKDISIWINKIQMDVQSAGARVSHKIVRVAVSIGEM